MAETDVKISVPFESLVSTVKKLKYERKIELLELIEEQIEEELLTKNPQIKHEIDEARAAYKIRDYVTLDEYKARNKERLS